LFLGFPIGKFNCRSPSVSWFLPIIVSWNKHVLRQHPSYKRMYDSYSALCFRCQIYSAVMRQQLRNLQASDWIDAFTSAVILEMTLYHPQSSLFGSVLLALELPPIGRVRTSSRIASVYLYKYSTSLDHFVLACEVWGCTCL